MGLRCKSAERTLDREALEIPLEPRAIVREAIDAVGGGRVAGGGVLGRAAVIGALLLSACVEPTASDSLWLRAERVSFGIRVTVVSDLSTTAWPDPFSVREGLARFDYRTSNDSLVLGTLTLCGSAMCLETWRRGLVTPDSLVLVDASSVEYRYMRRRGRRPADT